jgi:hypothetical protein
MNHEELLEYNNYSIRLKIDQSEINEIYSNAQIHEKLKLEFLLIEKLIQLKTINPISKCVIQWMYHRCNQILDKHITKFQTLDVKHAYIILKYTSIISNANQIL